MEFRIADTFTESLTRLTADEQKVVKTTAFDLQLNPARPGMSLHKLDHGKDKSFWSVRAGRDLRIIVHRTNASLLLCYVDHHDDAYAWAERRKLETHPKTGAAQLVEIRERVEQISIPLYVAEEAAEPNRNQRPLFDHVAEEELLGYGVPDEWLEDVRQANEDSLLSLADHLPAEAAEALLELATGGTPRVSKGDDKDTDPFLHPDALRRFRVMQNAEELAQALEYPWEKWAIFLHPAQEQWVERDYNGPARVSGSAGTGKTIVALHRAVHLARTRPDGRVLLTTFSDALANALRIKLRRLVAAEPKLAERLDVRAMDAVGERLFELQFGALQIAPPGVVRELIMDAANQTPGHRFGAGFLVAEWWDVVDAWQLDTWEEYRDVKRLGRRSRLSEQQRAMLWSIYDVVKTNLHERGLLTRARVFNELAHHMGDRSHPPYDYVVVDESQDVSVSQLRFLASLGAGRPNALFFAGDLGQRIFQQPFSWLALGVDIRGRSRTLNINYRTSHQIRMQVDRLLGPEVSDVDGNTEVRAGTVSVFSGPRPTIEVFDNPASETKAVSSWLTQRHQEGLLPHEIGVFVRSEAELERGVAAAKAASIPYKVLNENVETTSNYLSISTMHLAKGLEFRAVAVVACNDEVIPLQARIETAADASELEEVYNTERHLLYVACTRARDHLWASAGGPASEFLDDLRR